MKKIIFITLIVMAFFIGNSLKNTALTKIQIHKVNNFFINSKKTSTPTQTSQTKMNTSVELSNNSELSFENSISTNEICKKLENSNNLHLEQIKTLNQFGLSNFSEKFEIQRSFTAQGAFYYGLAKSGLLLGSKNTIDLSEGYEFLFYAHTQDPKNSAPLLYLALLEYKRNNLQKSNYFLSIALNTKYFDTYLIKLTHKLTENTSNYYDYLNSIGILSKVPIPNYLELEKIIPTESKIFFSNQIFSNLKIVNYDSFEQTKIEYKIAQSLMPESKESLDLNEISINLKSENNKNLENIIKTCDNLAESIQIVSYYCNSTNNNNLKINLPSCLYPLFAQFN